jgi:hypothetical protein
MEQEELPPEAQLLESLRAVGYSLETAVADIVDNSISALATKIDLEFRGLPKPHLSILDNGEGMTKIELRIAMRLAGKSRSSDRTPADLGRFGLGLKTASFSQAKRLTVATKVRNGPIHVAVWDLDLIERENRWILQWIDPRDVDSDHLKVLEGRPSGTLVLWEQLDQVSSALKTFDAELRDQALRTSDHLALVFHRFIDAPKASRVSFTLNGQIVEAIDPFFSKMQATVKRPTTAVSLNNGTVEVTPFILPHISQLTKSDAKVLEAMRKRFKDSQGFYVYRGKRLISYGSWFRLSPKTELAKMARVRVDTPSSLDRDWKLGIMKSSVEPPPELRKVLARIVPNIVGDSRRVVMRKGSKLSNTADSAWAFREVGPKLFKLEVNREHPLLIALTSKLSEMQISSLDLYLGQIESGVPAVELLNRLSADQAFDSLEPDRNELQSLASRMMTELRGAFASPEHALDAVYQLEPFVSDPFAREALDTWREKLLHGVQSNE